MTKSNVKKPQKATREMAERLDFISAEMDKLRALAEDGHAEKLQQLNEEYWSSITDYDWFDEEFEENGKRGLKNVKGEIVVPAIYDGFCAIQPYFRQRMGVGAKKGDKVALVARDGKGTPRTEFEFDYIENIPLTTLYAVFKGGDKSHFALMVADRVFTPYELTAYYEACDGCLILRGDDNKHGVLELERLVYIGPEYDEVIDEGVGENFTFIKNGVEGWVTLDSRFVSKVEYSQMSDEEQDNLLEIGIIGAADL